MWQFTVYTILLATMLVAVDHVGADPQPENILVARRLTSRVFQTKLTKHSAAQHHSWIQINGENAGAGEMSYFRAYGETFEEYRVWNSGRSRYDNFGGFTKRINVCRHGEGASMITDDDCSAFNTGGGFATDFSFFVAEQEKPRTTKVYSTVCHDENKHVGYSTLSTINNHCWRGSRVIKSSSFYVYVGKPFCKPLRQPPGDLGTSAGQTYDHGIRVTTRQYRCPYGYDLRGSETINCGSDGKWDGRPPTCEAKKCGPPLPLNHGRASKGPFSYSDRITYTCDEGYYRYPSNAVIECMGDGKWSGSVMVCRPVDCGFPGSLEHGRTTGRLYTYGRKLIFKCGRKFARVGPKEMTCQANKTWSNELPRCERIVCPRLNPIPNSRQGMSGRVGIGSEVFVLCNDGYKIEGSITLKCILKIGSKREAEWNHPPPVCSRITCPKPQSVENGKVFGNEYFYNSEVTYTCDTGYSLEGNDRLTCTVDNWDGEPPTCRAIICRDPGVPRHGQRTGVSMTYGSELQFECDVGYTMLGQQNIICGEGKRWTAAKPVCEAIVCPPIGSPAHGSVELSSGESGSSAIFSCFAGYYMTGGRESRCLTSGHWSGSIPTCQACPIGYYKEGSNDAQCVQCPPNSNTSSHASFSPLHCSCDSNSHSVDGGPCEVVQCPILSAPEHGEITSCSRNYRDSCSFQCDPGYILSGYRLRTCSKTGWTGDPAFCSACPENTYKHMQGSSTCIPCPRQTTTGEILGVSIESCACAPGYHGPPGGPCQDVNECATDNGGCSQTCLNTPGSFRCSCSIPGYLMSLDHRTCYMNQTCPQIQQEVEHGRTTCRYTEEENGYICYIKCDPSYFFVSGINNYVTCGADSGFDWSHRMVNRTAKIPACTKEFFVDMNLPISFKYRSEHSCNELPIYMSQLESQIIQSVKNLRVCGSFCEIRDFNATYSEIDDGGCEATVMMGIFMKNPDENAIAVECDPTCKRLNMREMLRGTFVMKTNVSDLVSNRPENLIVPRVEGTTVITSSFTFGRPQMLCDPGKVLSSNRLCVPCDSGYYLPDRSLQACLPCPKGTYQMHQGQIACQPCDRYTTTVTAGSDHPAMCTVRIELEATNGITSTTESNAAAGDEDQSEVDPVL